MSAINLQHEIQFEFIKNSIKERPDNQKILKHANKTKVKNMDHSETDELISDMLKNGMVCDKFLKIEHYISL